MNPNTIPSSDENQENSVNEWADMDNTGVESTGDEGTGMEYEGEGSGAEASTGIEPESGIEFTGDETMTGMEGEMPDGTGSEG